MYLIIFVIDDLDYRCYDLVDDYYGESGIEAIW